MSVIVGRLMVVWIWLLSCVALAGACARNSVLIENNGYSGLLIAIAESVPENPSLLREIREAFTEASAVLYEATRYRAYFANITILVPRLWPEHDYSPSNLGYSFGSANVMIDNSNYTAPFTLNYKRCGEEGQEIRITPEYFLSNAVDNGLGTRGRVLVHEWAHLRYGVFDEYPNEKQGPFFYLDKGNLEAVRCSLAIEGEQWNIFTNKDCQKDSYSLPEYNCRFFGDNGESSGYASLMYSTFLDKIDQFCDNNSSNEYTFHNKEAPNRQNTQCGYRSVWEVLREHPDFNGVNEPRKDIDAVPNFNILQLKSDSVVLVLDISGSMNGSMLKILGQGCSYYITDIVKDNTKLGVVWFNATAYRKASLTLIDDFSRKVLLDSIPLKAGGGTSIAAGIVEAIHMLSVVDGGNIIVVSDGEENVDPLLHTIGPQIEASGVTIHSLAFTNEAESQLDVIARQSKGKSFQYSGILSSSSINEAFQAIGDSFTDLKEKHNMVNSRAEYVAANGIMSGSVFIDSSLGKRTTFTFDYAGADIQPSITSPYFQRYDRSSAVVSHNGAVGRYRFSVPDSTNQTGEWLYHIRSLSSSKMLVTITVTSSASSDAIYPITVFAHWLNPQIQSIAPGHDNEIQILYAVVSQGHAPVLQANVTAIVETATNSKVYIDLHDNGADPDTAANDGVYSAYFLMFDDSGRYGVTVIVHSNEDTVIHQERIIGLE